MKPVPTYELLLGGNRVLTDPCSHPWWTSSVGEQSTGACIGTSYSSCLVIRGYASQPQQPEKRRLSGPQRCCRVRWSGRVSHSALHLFVEEVSPVIHHRLKTMVREPATAAWVRTTTTTLRRSPTEVSAIFTTDHMYEQGASPW